MHRIRELPTIEALHWSNSLEITKYLIQQGADNLNKALSSSKSLEIKNYLKYF